jgi:D-glycero-beta-D-manno-heptose-7-phosphate kinase
MIELNEQDRLLDLAERFEDRKISIVGDVMCDIFEYGPSAYNPEASVPRINFKKHDFRLGGAGNTGANTASLMTKIHNNSLDIEKNQISAGHGINLYGVVGEDEYGQIVRNLANSYSGAIEMDRKGEKVFVNNCRDKRISFICFREGLTVRKNRFVEILPDGRFEYRLMGSYGDLEPGEHVSSDGAKTISGVMVDEPHSLILSHYGKGVLEYPGLSEKLISWAKYKNAISVIDPKPNRINPENIEMFSGADYICPNIMEAAWISGRKEYDSPTSILEGEYKEIARDIADRLKIERGVAVSCGAKGCVAYDVEDKNFYFIPTKPVKYADVVGAGDTWISAFTLGVCSGGNIKEACNLANRASGVVVGKQGTAVCTLDELVRNINFS